MEKGTEKEKQIICWAWSLVINCLALMLAFIFWKPKYEMPDDYGMSAIANGLFGNYDEHLVFAHIWLGKLIVALNKIGGTVNWYSVIQYATVFASFSIACYVLIKRNRKGGILLSAALLIVFGLQLYVHPQFTKTAGIATIVGFFVIIVERELLIPGICLVLLGAMWRWSGWLLWPALMLPFGFAEVFKNVFHKSREIIIAQLKKYIGIVGIAGLLVLAAAGIWKINDWEYDRDAGWADYMEWDTALSSLIDYFFPYYYDDYDMYQSMGISEADLDYYMTWNIADTSVLTTENLQRMLVAKEAYWTSIRTRLVQFLQTAPANFLKISVFPIVVVLGIIYALYREEKTGIWLPCEIIMVVLLYFYMYYTGRVFVNRVDVPVMFSVALVMAYYISGVNDAAKYRAVRNIAGVGLIGAALLLSGSMARENLRSREQRQESQRCMTFLNHIAQDKEHFYVGTMGTIPISAVDIFVRMPEGSLENAYGTVGWLVNTPVTQKLLVNHNMENIYSNCIDNDKVYWVGGEFLNETVTYICDNYRNVTFELNNSIEGWNLYSVKSD